MGRVSDPPDQAPLGPGRDPGVQQAREHREATELFADPREEYTKTLLAAIAPAEPRAGARM